MEKIEGWADVHVRDGLVEGWFGQDAEEKFPRATLVIGDERVFAESEVRAIIERLTASDVFTDGQRQYIIHAAWDGGVSFADPA
jgi:hypothetical protein